MLAAKPLRLLVGACFATCVAAVAGDDFSNNLFTDLTPLLALFGERVTTQFMSQSTGWADNIILAMAPLGIITAIVSAIRVGGPSWLKAIIGRARENRAVAESELMSSTSREVCELWNGRQVVRVMGEGPIWEFIIISPERNGNNKGQANAQAIARTQTATGATGSNSVSSQMTGLELDEMVCVMDLERAEDEKILEACNPTIRERISGRLTPQNRNLSKYTREHNGEKGQEVHQPILPLVRAYVRRIFRRRVHQGQDLENPGDRDTHETPSDSNSGKPDQRPSSVVVVRNRKAYTPNLTLNVHNQVGRGELYTVAASSIVLQFGILVYFGIAAKYLRLILLKDGNPVAYYAFPCTTAGTLLLITGILICGYVVESSTLKTRYRPVDGTKARVVWLQRSGTVNDQAFESYAIFPNNPQALITTSQQAPRRRLKDLRLMRGGHESLGTQETKETTSEQPQKAVSGQSRKTASERFLEVEVEEIIATTGTTFSICGYIMQFIGLRGMHWSAPVAQLGAIVVMAILRAWVRRNLAKNPKSQPLLSGHEMDWLAMTLEDPTKAPWRNPSEYDGKRDKYDRPWADHNAWDWKIVSIEHPAKCEGLKRQVDTGATNTDGSVKLQTNNNGIHQGSNADSEKECWSANYRSRAHRVLMTRRDLGELADWHGPASVEAISLARAVEVTMDALFGPTSVGRAFTWSIKASGCESLAFHVKRRDGKWKAYSDEIEAALSLWLYSVYEQENSVREAKQKEPLETKETRKKDGGKSPKDDAWLRAKGRPAKPSLRLLGSHTAALLRDLQWWMPDGASKVIEVVVAKSKVDSSIMQVESHRIVGFASEPGSTSIAEPHAYLCERMPVNPSHEGSPLAVKSYSPLKTLYAQHMFSTFMWAAAKAMEPIPSKADIRPAETDSPNGPLWRSFALHDSQLSRMAEDIQSTRLGSLEDVFLSIIPPLSTEKKLPQVGAIVEWAREHAKPHEQQGRWDEAVSAYLWLFRKAKTFPEQDDIVTKATALLVDYLRAVTDAIMLRTAQQFEERDIQALERLNERLETELQTAGVDDILSRLMGLYKAQRRRWESPIVENPKDLGEEDLMLKFTGLHRSALNTGWDSKWAIERWMERRMGDPNVKDILDWTPLHYAAAKPSLDALQKLLKYRADVNSRDIRGRTPLHYACQHGNISIVQDLLREGAEINMRDIDGIAPLHDVAFHGHSSVMQLLIEAGADIDIVDGLGNTPLHQAAYKGCKDLVKLLEDASIKMRNRNGRTALHLATIAEEGTAVEREEVVRALIRKNADKNAKDRNSQTPLHFAAQKGHSTITEYLIKDAKAEVEARDQIGCTPLHFAAQKGHLTIIKYLIEEVKVEVKAEDQIGRTPLHFAIEKGHTDVVKYLMEEAKAEVDGKDNWTQLHFAAENSHLDIVKYLMEEAKAEVEAKDKGDWTQLHFAARNGHSDTVKYLIEEGKAEVEAKDRIGRTPLHFAAQRGHSALIKYLVKEAKAKVEARDQISCTPLHFAAQKGYLTIVKYLIEEVKANKEAKDQDDWTLLHFAAEKGHLTIIKYLIEEVKAEVDAKAWNGRTPLHFAAQKGHSIIVNYLIQEAKADTEAKDRDGRTPLDLAASRRSSHELRDHI